MPKFSRFGFGAMGTVRKEALYRVRRISDGASVSARSLSDGGVQLLWCCADGDASAFIRARAQAVSAIMAMAAAAGKAGDIVIEEAQ